MVTEHLAAKGQFDEWLDASQIALDVGKFTKIRTKFKDKTIMTAEYGADHIALTFEPRDEGHITLTIECDDQEVLEWYKHCVRDVIRHPEKYADYYAEPEEEDTETPERGEKPIDPEWLNNVKERVEENEHFQRAERFFEKKWFLILITIIFPPAGVFLFFRYHPAKLTTRILVTVLMVVYFLFIWLGLIGLNTGFGINTIKNAVNSTTKTVDTMINGEPVKEQPTER